MLEKLKKGVEIDMSLKSFNDSQPMSYVVLYADEGDKMKWIKLKFKLSKRDL